MGLRVARRRTAGHHGVEPSAFLIEGGEQRTLEHTAARQLYFHRVDEAPIDQNFKCRCDPVDSPVEPI